MYLPSYRKTIETVVYFIMSDFTISQEIEEPSLRNFRRQEIWDTKTEWVGRKKGGTDALQPDSAVVISDGSVIHLQLLSH